MDNWKRGFLVFLVGPGGESTAEDGGQPSPGRADCAEAKGRADANAGPSKNVLSIVMTTGLATGASLGLLQTRRGILAG